MIDLSALRTRVLRSLVSKKLAALREDRPYPASVAIAVALAVGVAACALTQNGKPVYAVVPSLGTDDSASPAGTGPAASRMCTSGDKQCEDFTGVDDGGLPAGWVGGETLLVAKAQGAKVLKPFKQAEEHAVSAPWVAEGDFSFKIRFSYERRGLAKFGFSVLLGSVTAGITYEDWLGSNDGKVRPFVGETANAYVPCADGLPHDLEIERTGQVVKVFLDGAQVVLARDDAPDKVRQVRLSLQSNIFVVHGLHLRSK